MTFSVALFLALTTSGVAADFSESPEPSVTLQPRRGKGLLIAAAAVGGFGTAATAISVLLFIGPGSVLRGGGWFGPSYDIGTRVATFCGAVVGGSLMLMAAIMTIVGIVKWRNSAPVEAPDENLRLTAFTPKPPPLAPVVAIDVLRF